MTDTTRTLAWVAFLGMLLGAALGSLLTSRTARASCDVPSRSSGIDSGEAVRLRDSLARALSVERRRSDSLQAYLDTCPADTVPRWFARNVPVEVRDTTRDTIRLPAPLARAVAESLVACRFGRDSAAGEVLVERERRKSYSEALDLCQRSLGGMPAPSSGGATWTVSAVLQADGNALRPGVGVDWHPFAHLQVGLEGYAQRDGTRPGIGLRAGFSW